MSGAISFVLGLLGLGASGAISAGEHVSQAKTIAEYKKQGGWDATGERRQMYERVRKEWYSIGSFNPNCLGKYRFEYPDGAYSHSQDGNWFKAHLDAKGIPYDDIILDQVSGINYDKTLNDLMMHPNRRRWRLF